jgi:hypothetical protein
VSKKQVKPTFSDIVDLVRKHYLEAFGVEMGYAKAAELVDEAIRPQKQAHADMVIGKDIPQYFENSKTRTSKGIWYEAQQALVNEQRERNRL